MCLSMMLYSLEPSSKKILLIVQTIHAGGCDEGKKGFIHIHLSIAKIYERSREA